MRKSLHYVQKCETVWQWEVKWDGVCMHVGNISIKKGMTNKQKPRFAASTWAGALLTCLEQGGGVGGALTVVRDGRHVDLVLLTTFEHGDLTAGGGRCAVKGRAGAIDSCGPVQIGPEYQIPSHCHHAAGAAVVHRDGRHWVNGWVKEVWHVNVLFGPSDRWILFLRYSLEVVCVTLEASPGTKKPLTDDTPTV